MKHGDTVTSATREAKPTTTFTPRTLLGKRLWTLRQTMLTTGESLLDWDGVIREVQERRGEQDNGGER